MDFSKFHIGKVIYNEDPSCTGRCKIRVFGMFDGLEDDFIPWFKPIASSVFSTNGAGSISVPKVGDIVRVTFSNNDLYSGEYTTLQCLDPALVEEIKDDYVGTQVLLFDAEAELMVLYQPNTGFKIFHKGSQILLDPTGMIQLKHANNQNVIEMTDGNITITTAKNSGGSAGTINITAGTQVNITADNVNVNANKIKLGTGANNPAVKGEELQRVLQEISRELAVKMPMGSLLMGRNFEEILSSNVTLK